jgi:hypothetical protein
VGFPDSACGNGQPTGLGLNPGPAPGSTELLLYLQGGGACWDALTCFGLKIATHVEDGYTGATFASETLTSSSFFDRTLPGNPFATANLAFVPYCTGDVHAGASVQNYPGAAASLHHHGAQNLDAFLGRLKSTFPAVTRVYLAGSSAGAFGAQLNFERVVSFFPSAQVHVLADSGQMINPGTYALDGSSLLSDWLAAWRFSVPSGCTGCDTDFAKYPAYLATTYPESRFALLAYTQDQVLRTFFSWSPTEYEARTRALLASVYVGRANAHSYLAAGSTHTMLGSVGTVHEPAGLLPFLVDWKAGNPGWANVSP